MSIIRNDFCICVIYIFITAFYQDPHDYIYWDQRRELTWKDFKVKHELTKNDTNIIARVSWSFITTSLPQGNKLVIHCHTISYKNLSWVKNGGGTDEGLRHEQGHFDIAESNCRKLRKAITEAKYIESTYNHLLDSLTYSYHAQCSQEQDQYDTETNHSFNKEKQLEWLKLIKQELEEWKDYANSEMVVGISEK